MLLRPIWVLLLGFAATARAADPCAACIQVATVNLAMNEDAAAIAKAFREKPELANANVLLFQEVIGRSGRQGVAEELGKLLGMHAEFRPAFTMDDGRMYGLAILSRLPMQNVRAIRLPAYDLNFRSRKRIALAADVEAPSGTLTVFDVHLDTRISGAERLRQLEPVVKEAAASKFPVIVGGDFNSNQFRWFMHVLPMPGSESQPRKLQEYMTKAGFRSALPEGKATHDFLGMQLDWVFFRGLSGSNPAILPLAVSDHHALALTLSP